MKNPTEMLKEVKTLLGMEVNEAEEVKVEAATEDTQVEESVEVEAATEVSLETMSLENGTQIEAAAFEPEMEVFVITEEDKIAMPVGEYALEDGRLLVVEEEGIIKEIKEVSGEEPVAEEEMAEEVEFATKSEVAELKAIIEELQAALSLSKEEVVEEEAQELKEELSQPAAKPLKHNPEGEKKEVKRVLYAQNRRMSVQDRVMSKIANIKK